ncbi:MAG: cytidylate kinase-like family protein [Lachnospiraceae bacterium]|nr:cytidylate kinase-like family protein [Lachnospiraceae bacterium]
MTGKNYIITIARGFGSGGKEIAQKLSEKLGIPWYERQILKMASEQSGIAEALFHESDEKIKGKKLAKLIGQIPNPYVVQATSNKFTSEVNLFNIQAEIIRTLAKTESCIIVGKCANMILKDYDNVLSVYIEAPRAACVQSVMNKMGVTEKEAHRLISRTDKYRADYYKFYTGGHYWTDPVAYDVTLNSDRMGRDKCVDVICDLIDIKLFNK